MTRVNTAVILAAGLGSRLKEHANARPKGFLEIDGQTLIERSIMNLLGKGITRIIIGTGYLAEYFDALVEKYPVIVTMRNEAYASSGSLYTLYTLRDLIDQPFLLLENDLLYESAALDHLLDDPYEDIILASDKTHSGDEVYIQSSAERFLQSMSKNPDALDHVDGELVGITKLSLPSWRALAAFAEQQYGLGNRAIHYEDGLVGIAQHRNIQVKVIVDLAWCEIDDESHLRRAIDVVYPKILERR